MEPIVYQLPFIDPIKIDPEKLFFHHSIPIPLMKYGNQQMISSRKMNEILSLPHHHAGLKFNFDITDNNSFAAVIISKLKTDHFDLKLAEIWEIWKLFSFDKWSHLVWGEPIDLLKRIMNLMPQKAKLVHQIENLNNSISLIWYRYSDTNLGELGAITIIIKDIIPKIKSQSESSCAIIQLFQIQTEITVHLISFLSSYYQSSYLVKPLVTSELSDIKYLVLISKKKDQMEFPHLDLENNYIHSLGIDVIPEMNNIIQCINSELEPNKVKKYVQIKKYLDSHIYEGAIYQAFVQSQQKYIEKWIQLYLENNDYQKVIDNAVENSSSYCNQIKTIEYIF